MGLFDKFLKRIKKDEEISSQDFLSEYGGKSANIATDAIANSKKAKKVSLEEINSYSFEEGNIIGYEDGVIDTTSPETIAKYLHNMRLLMNNAKEKGKVDNFYIIREDDYFPKGWEWNVLSDQTNLEPVRNSFSMAVRKQYALDKAGLSNETQFGIRIPIFSPEEEQKALDQVPHDIADIMLPSHFRSTKHFTLSTPLGVTGDYNAVKTGRNFIVFDKPDNLIKSGYAYSVADHDVYGDVSHESIKISDEGFVLIDDEKYDGLMQDEELKKELEGKKVFRYKGDPTVAIAMALASHGALPTRCILPDGLDTRTLSYDSELSDIIENSIKDMARDNGLFHDKSHAGKLSPEGGGHFSNYYDDKNKDHFKAVTEFVAFLREKFPEKADLLPDFLRLDYHDSASGRIDKIVDGIGAQNLVEAISEYNSKAIERMDQTFKAYKEDRKNITPEMHDKFVGTISAINEYYKTPEAASNYEIEASVQAFLQGKSVKEQSDAADTVLTMLGITKAALSDKRVSLADLDAVRNVEELEHTKDGVNIENEGFNR